MQRTKISQVAGLNEMSAAMFLLFAGMGVSGGEAIAVQRSGAMNSGRPIVPQATDMDRLSMDEVSVDVIQKAREIETLAGDVQRQMKN